MKFISKNVVSLKGSLVSCAVQVENLKVLVEAEVTLVGCLCVSSGSCFALQMGILVSHQMLMLNGAPLVDGLSVCWSVLAMFLCPSNFDFVCMLHQLTAAGLKDGDLVLVQRTPPPLRHVASDSAVPMFSLPSPGPSAGSIQPFAGMTWNDVPVRARVNQSIIQ